MGQVVVHQQVVGMDAVTVNATDWPAGTYVVAIVTESGKVVRKKVLVQ